MLNIYALFDAKIEGYLPPFTMKADGQAKRAMLDAMQNNTTDIARHPEDFSLFRLGVFDEENGLIIPCEPPYCVCKCWELKPNDGSEN